MTQSHRIEGGQIDRSKTLRFTFDGIPYQGHPGDTLASALLANGVRLMGRSFKYHRPRGPLSAGSEEPNALVELRSGGRQEPNTRATVAELYEGLTASSQNRWPSLRFDAMGINDKLSTFFAAGFYYKTFMWPKSFWEKLYEPIIRRAAGLGSVTREEDPDAYDKGFLHCDLLVIGAGPAGLMAALTAGQAGKRVILADEDFRMGGRLNAETFAVGQTLGADWAAAVVAELSTMPNVRLMTRTTVVGAFDHGIYSAVERVSDHLPTPAKGKPRQVLWRIYTGKAILAGGATERPIAFENNDRPGIMLSGALRAYANRWGVKAGERVAVFTNNDDGLRTAIDLQAKGIDVVAVIDSRDGGDLLPGIRHLRGADVIDTSGKLGLTSITIRQASGRSETLTVDALGISGGWNPNVNIHSHHRSRPVYDPTIAAFVPDQDGPPGLLVAGAAAGQMSTHAALKTGRDAAIAAFDLTTVPDLPQAEDAPVKITPLWHVAHGKGRAWIDQQNDVTVKDVKLAKQENFTSVEHLKRYTTLGMATDQGKLSNINGLSILAQALNVGAAQVSLKLGPEAFYRYLRDFGIGRVTEVDLAGESAGIVKNPNSPLWSESDLATNAYGQGLAVTPLQLATAIAAIANDGVVMKPHLVRATVDRGRPIPIRPKAQQRAISAETARAMRQLMRDATARGIDADLVPGYQVAGKTGTAQVPTSTGYSEDMTIATYVAFLPADDPRVVVLVKLDRPTRSTWAAEVTVPVFQRIAVELVRLLDIPPDAVRLSRK